MCVFDPPKAKLDEKIEKHQHSRSLRQKTDNSEQKPSLKVKGSNLANLPWAAHPLRMRRIRFGAKKISAS